MEFESQEALENVFDLYVKQRKLKYVSKLENPRFEKVDPVFAVLLMQYVHTYGYPSDNNAHPQKRKTASPEKTSSQIKKPKADEENDDN